MQTKNTSLPKMETLQGLLQFHSCAKKPSPDTVMLFHTLGEPNHLPLLHHFCSHVTYLKNKLLELT